MALGAAAVEMDEERGRMPLAAAVLLYAAVVGLLCRALDEQAIRLALRLQGRLSFAFFVAVLVAPAAQRAFGGAISSWLLRERSTLCQAFCLSHLIHGCWIGLFYARTANVFELNLVDLSGALAFPLLLVLLWLQLSRPVAVASLWRARLSAAILAYEWLQFFGFFVDRLLSGRRPELRGWYVVGIAISLLAAGAALRFRARQPRVAE